MEESTSSTIFDAKITGIRFAMATRHEICKASISDCPISHASQLSNPFLGLPLEAGRCESCGTAEPGQCEGHFGYIEFPTPIYHPDHVGELKRMLSLLCLKCLKMKNRKVKNIGVAERVLSSCCEETSLISINEVRTTDGACFLELKIPSRSVREGFWNFLEKYGFRYGRSYSRALLPSEVMEILKKIPKETRKKLDAKGYFPQDGYILQHLPVPPNCLSVPDVSDGISTMSTDYSITLLKKVLKQVEVIKNSRSGTPNFESHEIEANDLQAAVAQYFHFRGTGKASRDVDTRFGVNKDINASSTKAWLEKMKTLFIRKGSGFSSRSVITGDSFKGVSEIGLPFEIAQKITFEERVNQHNMECLQRLVDEKLCLTYRDGQSTYSLREGSKGHTFLKPGQIVHRRIMDGDVVFINRPPTTHKHSLQALSVYIHDDHTVKINPLICSPLSADFDGDCIHLFYPQSLEAKAEVVELFSVEKQLLSSHTGNFNLQLGTDSLLSLKLIFQNYYLSRAAAQQLAMFAPNYFPGPAVLKSCKAGPLWTAAQILQITLPPNFDCSGERHFISKSEVLTVEFNRDVMQAIINDIVTSIFFLKGPKEVLGFFNTLQPQLMENLYSEGFSVSLRDLFIPGDILKNIQADIQKISPLLHNLRACYSESIALQLENYLRSVKIPVTNFILKSSAIGHLIDSKSESALSKVVQQIGFLGLQLADKGKFYTGTLVNAMSSLFQNKYPSSDSYPTEKYGLVGRPLFQGLDPYQEMVHSISSREVIVRSSRGLTEPGTLFKNLMAVLRDVMICHDGTVRNMCSNSIIQFEYGVNTANISNEFAAGDPVGVLAATAMSNPAYKAVLDSSSSSNSSWEMMKEMLLCGVNFKNDTCDRRIMLYLNDCDCGRKYCQEKAASMVKTHLTKVSLMDASVDFLIEYRLSEIVGSEIGAGLVGHLHLDKLQLIQSNISMNDILEKCQDTINLCQKKKKVGNLFKRIDLSFSNCCSFRHSAESKSTDIPCLQFFWIGANDDHLERISHILADTVCPVLLETIIKGDPMVLAANIIWINSDATSSRSPSKSQKGELALDIILEKKAVRKSGDAWRVVMDSCLPVIHLIDIKRSIPYAVKQVQELLGISCAFEQAVQRLSTSVTMVTKGVLKDHLLLLANSMTCGGNLIGFNAGGIKSLSRSLNLQVPFMEATLFTPRKCFERAAEKCHVDALTSIVASCSWGKHASVGTGSPFEILWDTRKAELNQQNGLNVYDFLHLVSSSSKQENMGTSCLGEEIDYLDQEDEYMESDLSPVRDSGIEKPTFEDGDNFSLEENEWVQTSSITGKSSSNWEQVKKVESPTHSGWGIEREREDDDLGGSWGQVVEKVKNSTPSGWGVDKGRKDDTFSEKAPKDSPKNNRSAWGKKVDSAEKWSTEEAEQSTWASANASKSSSQSSWGQVVEKVQSTTPGWGFDKGKKDDTFFQKAPEDSPTNRSAWGKKVDFVEKGPTENAEQSTWASANASKSSGQSSWGQAVEKVQSSTPGWGVDRCKKDDTVSKKAPEDSPKNSRSAWGKKVDSVENGPTEKAEQSTWASANASKSSGQSSWGQAVEKVQSSTPGWGVDRCKKDDTVSKKAPEDSPKNSRSAWGKKVDSVENGPTEKAEQSTWASANASKSSGQSYWGKDVRREDGSPTLTQEYQSVSFSAWGKKQDSEGRGWMEKDNQNNWSSASTPTQKGHSNWVRSSGEKDWSGKDDRNTLVNAGTPKSSSQSGWGRESDEAGWNKKKDQGRWAIPSAPKDNNQSSWGRDAAQMEDVIPAKAQEDSKRATDWDTLGSDSGQDGSGSWSSWGKKIAKSDEIGKKSDRLISSADGDSIDVLHSNENLWEAKVADHGNQSKPSAWGASNDGGKVDSQSPREQKKDSPVSTWNPTPKESNDSGFAPRRHFAGRGDSNRGRGRGRSGGDWKNNRGRGRSSGRGDFSDDFNTLGTFTVTRQRMDLFTVDEQDILSDVEAIMKNIRRIMNQTGYNDGDPISGDDQSYMVDNVLNYHPDKAAKMGAGLKYIMVSRHQEFQDSRCFYAVSLDGVKQDFSYRKCVENFLKEKYTNKAEGFITKYYRRQQARSGWNKDRGSASGEARTPGWKRDRTPAANEAGTPCWGQDRTPAPEEAGTPGWCQERTPAAEESGTQGWNTDRSTPAQDEAGTPGWNTGRSTPARDEAGTPGWNAGCSTPARGEAENPGWNTDIIRAREEAGASVWNKSGSR